MGVYRLLAVCLLLVAGCATPLPPECKTEYAGTLMHCPKPKPQPPANEAQCEAAGGVSIIEDGDFKGCVSHERVREVVCRLQGGIRC